MLLGLAGLTSVALAGEATTVAGEATPVAGEATPVAGEVTAVAGGAPSGGLGEKLGRATLVAERAAERAVVAAQRANQRANQRATRRAQRKAERETRREARRKSNEALRQKLKEKEGDKVTITCTEAVVNYRQFNAVAGKPNLVFEWIEVKNPPESISKEPIRFPANEPIKFFFEGASGTDVEHIAFPVGHYLVDIHSKWDTNGRKGNFDIHGNVTCKPSPAFTVGKLQTIAGSGKPLTSETLTGVVGQVIDYQVTATNTGNTPLTFTNFSDHICDPGTIVGGSLVPVEPLGTLTYTCTHKITTADQRAGAVVNVATVTASPEQNEGGTFSHESNAVVVAPVAEAKPEEKPEENTGQKTGGGTKTEPPPASTLGSSGGAAGSATTPTGAKGGVLGFTSATVPALKGPQGCVRGTFVASLRANGVSSAIFYLDGRRIARLTSRNAHRGLLSVRINPAGLHIGVHHLLAQITMKQSSPSAKAARAARRLTVIRCASSVLTPKFTG